jgi:tRNA(Ile)-lysidine synthase TilS/MesJ
VTRRRISSRPEPAKPPNLAENLNRALQKSASLAPGQRVGVAVSGGADSVALLHLLLEKRQQTGIVLSVAHFNHKLRGKASDIDEKFVRKLAAEHGLEFFVAHEDIAARDSRDLAEFIRKRERCFARCSTCAARNCASIYERSANAGAKTQRIWTPNE